MSKDVDEAPTGTETDERFPSGPWKGYFLQREFPGKHWMNLDLTFAEGEISGIGSDWVGRFTLTGTYETESGRCSIEKNYLGRHKVLYTGFNEGRGIWGKWELASLGSGGFHIWPSSMGDLSQPTLREELKEPVDDGVVETASSESL